MVIQEVGYCDFCYLVSDVVELRKFFAYFLYVSVSSKKKGARKWKKR